MSGLSLSVSTYNNYANRGDGVGLFKHVLSGNDSTSGATGNDTFLSTSMASPAKSTACTRRRSTANPMPAASGYGLRRWKVA
ncbi:MAG TPA: hypothetical protein VEC35_07730 [Noviherbaspirillum sp.]|nr:hypothetical protein [Noviherbaspirillum sp.]